jgi:LPS sulfotransferase NodH|tara:strand:- start:450 stop:605 length:156 start_codon:yes stop_codon:yes gene_type:complete
MKTVSKSIAIQMKKMKDLEKKGDTGVYGKKLHANQSDVLKVQDVGKNQTFN